MAMVERLKALFSRRKKDPWAEKGARVVECLKKYSLGPNWKLNPFYEIREGIPFIVVHVSALVRDTDNYDKKIWIGNDYRQKLSNFAVQEDVNDFLRGAWNYLHAHEFSEWLTYNGNKVHDAHPENFND